MLLPPRNSKVWFLRILAGRCASAGTSSRTIKNFFAQAAGAEMLRCAAIAATEAGIRVCAPVHDAFLIEAPLNELNDAIETMRALMAKAALVVTNGLPVRIDCDPPILWPKMVPTGRRTGGTHGTTRLGCCDDWA